jgi:hypothetical protein
MSTISPGTRRKRTKMITDIPNSVRKAVIKRWKR